MLLHGDGRITQRCHIHVAHGHVVVTCSAEKHDGLRARLDGFAAVDDRRVVVDGSDENQKSLPPGSPRPPCRR